MTEEFQLRWGADVFLILANSPSTLEDLLKYSKTLTWWNSSAIFVAIEENPKNGNCSQAYSFLWTMWKIALLSSYFLCLDDLGLTTLYTFNPYNDLTPQAWKKTSSHEGRAGHPWNLYKRYYLSGPRNDIIFDKTRSLDGYQIRIVVCHVDPFTCVDKEQTGAQQFSGTDGSLLETLFTAWNVTIASRIFERCDFGYPVKNGSSNGIIGEIFSHRADMGGNLRYLIQHDELSTTYPHGIHQLCYGSMIRDRKSLPSIEAILANELSIPLFGLFLLSVAVLKFLDRRGLAWAIQNAIGMMLYNSLSRPPRTTPSRLIIYVEFLVLMVVHNVFSGQLVSLLMKPAAPIILDTMEDLEKSGYTIYGLPNYRRHFNASVMYDRYRHWDDVNECLRMVTEESARHVCVYDCLYMMFWSLKDPRLHVSKYDLDSYSLVYYAEADWPLLERATRDIQRIVESGLQGYWASMIWSLRSGRSPALSMESQPKSLSVESLYLVFYVLIFGLLHALFVFIMEVTTLIVCRKWKKMKS